MHVGHVFVSYSHEDREYTARLIDHLRNRGLIVYWDEDIPKGGRWHAELMAQIRSAAAFVVVMTETSELSEPVEREVLAALDSKTPVLPLQLGKRPFDLLANRQAEHIVEGAMPGDAFIRRLKEVTGKSPSPDPTMDSGFEAEARFSSQYVSSPETQLAAEKTNEAIRLAGQFRFGDALGILDDTLDTVPDFVPALVERAALLNNKQDWADALVASDRAAALDPDNGYAHGNRAVALVGLRRIDEARPAVERALALQPDNVRGHWLHGGILAQLGEYDLAVKAYDRALEISPELKPVQYARRLVALRRWTSKVDITRLAKRGRR